MLRFLSILTVLLLSAFAANAQEEPDYVTDIGAWKITGNVLADNQTATCRMTIQSQGWPTFSYSILVSMETGEFVSKAAFLISTVAEDDTPFSTKIIFDGKNTISLKGTAKNGYLIADIPGQNLTGLKRTVDLIQKSSQAVIAVTSSMKTVKINVAMDASKLAFESNGDCLREVMQMAVNRRQEHQIPKATTSETINDDTRCSVVVKALDQSDMQNVSGIISYVKTKLTSLDQANVTIGHKSIIPEGAEKAMKDYVVLSMTRCRTTPGGTLHDATYHTYNGLRELQSMLTGIE